MGADISIPAPREILVTLKFMNEYLRKSLLRKKQIATLKQRVKEKADGNDEEKGIYLL